MDDHGADHLWLWVESGGAPMNMLRPRIADPAGDSLVRNIMIVRHGPGRGRRHRYMKEVLEYIRRERSPLFSRLVLHATGRGRPSLEGVGAVVFWLADPLRERYPACFEEAVAIAEEAEQRGLEIINPPRNLSNSVKSVQARLWREAGIPTPPVTRFDSLEELRDSSAKLTYPLLIRGDLRHGQNGAAICQSPDELLRLSPDDLFFPCAVSPLIDLRSEFRKVNPASPYAAFHHKKRVIVAGPIIRTKHVFFSENPIVSSKSSTFGQFRQPLFPWSEPQLPPLVRAGVDEDVRLWRMGEEQEKLMRRACSVLGFDCAAIDYSSRPDGSVMLWEANPYFLIPTEDEITLPRLRLAKQRIESYYAAIADFLTGLAAGAVRNCAGRTAAML